MIQMKNLRYLAVAIGLATCCSMMAAENDSPKTGKWYDFEYEVNAGTNIGGATPLPLPAEIRHIGAFNPSLDLQIGGSITKWIDPAARWGVSLGVRLETKGMETRAGVKDYGMEIWQDGEMLNGRWTGQVKTRYSTQQLVIPVTGVWKANHRLRVNFGPYMAFAFKSHFDGRVYDGYLRVGNPTGDKVEFSGDSYATYDFASDLRHFQWGLQGGVSWSAFRHLLVNANLAWGMNGIFRSAFKTISFAMYPVYLNVGFGYLF